MAVSKASQDAKGSKKNYTAPALEKGLDILELLAGEPHGLTLSDIASRLDRSVSEIFRMLAGLQQREYIHTPPGSDSYSLTLKLYEILYQLDPVKKLINAARTEMNALTEAVKQSCHLAVYYRGQAVIIAQEDSPAPIGFSVKAGSEASLSDSCSGHVLLAFASGEMRQQMLEEQAHFQKNSLTKAEVSTLNKALDNVRAAGFERRHLAAEPRLARRADYYGCRISYRLAQPVCRVGLCKVGPARADLCADADGAGYFAGPDAGGLSHR